MKYCSNCGNPMKDEMLFCQKCGTKAAEPSTATTLKKIENTHSAKKDIIQDYSGIPRRGMKILSIICAILAIAYVPMSFIRELFLLSATAFFGILALMFLVLSKSPKNNPYIWGKQKGLKKSVFVIICVIFASTIIGTVIINGAANNTSNQKDNDSQQKENKL